MELLTPELDHHPGPSAEVNSAIESFDHQLKVPQQQGRLPAMNANGLITLMSRIEHATNSP